MPWQSGAGLYPLGASGVAKQELSTSNGRQNSHFPSIYLQEDMQFTPCGIPGEGPGVSPQRGEQTSAMPLGTPSLPALALVCRKKLRPHCGEYDILTIQFMNANHVAEIRSIWRVARRDLAIALWTNLQVLRILKASKQLSWHYSQTTTLICI